MAHTVSEFMTTNPTVIEVTDTLRSVAETMATQDLGSLVVAENGAVVGIVTDRDLVVRGLATGVGLDAPVGQLITDSLVSVGPDDGVAEVVQLMRDNAVRRVPVLDGDSALADISAAPPND
ncbi:MAG: CBS domain-containing protein [Actinomycetales bacterium]|nr:MAG: CBS domain-containing protein [Actinomycetales bacterium]